MTRVLLVEDDPIVAAGLARDLKVARFDVELVPSVASATRSLEMAQPHIVVLDIMLAGGSGFDVLRSIRATSQTPVIVLTALPGLDERLAAFGLGADDFLTKPCWSEELIARIRLRLRERESSQTRTAVSFGSACVDFDIRDVRLSGNPIGLTALEFRLLEHLIERRGRAVSRGQLVAALDIGAEHPERALDSYVARLRRKLGGNSGAIVTVFGIGYRFDPGDRT